MPRRKSGKNRRGVATPMLMIHEYVCIPDKKDIRHTNPWRYDPDSKSWVRA